MDNDAWTYAALTQKEMRISNRVGSQLFATSWLGLFETPITADKREIKDFPKFATQTSFIRQTLGDMHLNEKNIWLIDEIKGIY